MWVTCRPRTFSVPSLSNKKWLPYRKATTWSGEYCELLKAEKDIGTDYVYGSVRVRVRTHEEASVVTDDCYIISCRIVAYNILLISRHNLSNKNSPPVTSLLRRPYNRRADKQTRWRESVRLGRGSTSSLSSYNENSATAGLRRLLTAASESSARLRSMWRNDFSAWSSLFATDSLLDVNSVMRLSSSAARPTPS